VWVIWSSHRNGVNGVDLWRGNRFFSKRTTFNSWPCLYADVIQCVSLAIHYSLRFVAFYTVFLRRPVEKLGAINILRFITWSPKFAAGGGGGVAVRRNSLDTPTSSHVDNSKINNYLRAVGRKFLWSSACVCAHCFCPQDISRTGSWITTKFGGWEQGVNL